MGDADAVCIDDEVPYELPRGWAWSRLVNLCYPQEKPAFSSEYFKYIDINSIDNEKNCVREPKSVALKDAPSRANRKVRSGSTLFSMVRPYLRKIALIDDSLSDSVVSTGFYVASPISSEDLSLWLFLVLRSDNFVNTANSFMKGDNSPSIRKDKMDAMLIPTPPAGEAERIITLVSSMLRTLREL